MSEIESKSFRNRRLFSGSMLRVSYLVAGTLSSLFLLPFIVHHLGARVYGFWSLAMTFVGYYGLLDFGLSSAVAQYIGTAIGRKDSAECTAVFNTALRVQSVIGGIALLVTAVLAAATPWFCHDPADGAVFWRVISVLGVTTSLGFPARVYGAALEAEYRFDIQSWLAIFGLALRTGLSVLVILKGGGLLALSWVTLASNLTVAVLQIWFSWREIPWARIQRSTLGKSRLRSMFGYSAFTSVAMVADTLRFQIDPVLISAFIGLAAVTHYRVASVFTKYYVELIVAVVGIFSPMLSRLHGAGDRIGLERVFFFATKVSLFGSVFIGMALVSWGKPFIARWMGYEYKDAYWPLVTLAMAAFLDVAQNPSIGLLYATFRHRFYTYMNVTEGLVNLLFSLILAKPLGILGVAMGTLIGAISVRLIIQPWWVCKACNLSYSSYMKFLLGNLARCMGLMAVAVLFSSWGLKPNYLFLFCSAVCATLVYLTAAWFLVFSVQERNQLFAAITGRVKQKRDLPTFTSTENEGFT